MTQPAQMNSNRLSPAKVARALGGLVLIGLAGAAFGAAIARWAPASITDAIDAFLAGSATPYGWADGVAFVVAGAMIAVGVCTGLMSARPDWMRKGLKLDSAPTASERRDLALQSMAVGLAGVLYLIPLLAGPSGWSSPAAYGGVLVVLAVQSTMNWRLLRRSDELARRAMIEAGALCFWGFQAVLFLYAAAERLGMVEPLTAWTATVVVMPVYLAASVWAYARRGVV